jgi:hypothetical protein
MTIAEEWLAEAGGVPNLERPSPTDLLDWHSTGE